MYRRIYVFSDVLFIGAAIYLVIFHPSFLLIFMLQRCATSIILLCIYEPPFPSKFHRLTNREKQRERGEGERRRGRSLLAIALRYKMARSTRYIGLEVDLVNREMSGGRVVKMSASKSNKEGLFLSRLYNRNYWRIVRKIRLFTENYFDGGVSKSSRSISRIYRL